MCSLAPRAAAPAGFGATAFVDRQRGVVAAAAMAPASSVHKATREPVRRARASDGVSTAPAQKRGRHDHDVVDPAASSALRIRMDAELVALQGLLKRARLLPRSGSAPLTADAEKKHAPAPPVSSAAAERRRASLPKPAATAAKQQRKNPIAPEVPNSEQRPAAEAPGVAKKQQQHPVQRAAAAAAKTEVPKKRPPEAAKELARAAAREEFRQMLVEMEKAAPPDETIHPEELEALGIPFEFLVTRTWKQACLEYHAKKKQQLVA